MPLTLNPQQIALRILLALVASFLIGYDRDEHGKTAGIRTTMLVCLAATLAMLQANLLMDTTGKTSGSFVSLDLMRRHTHLEGLNFSPNRIPSPLRTLQRRQTSILEPWRLPFRKH